MSQSSRVDPVYFIRSFLVVAFHFVLLFVVLLFGLLGVSYLGFPETYELWNTDDADLFKKALAETPEKLWPVGLCVALCAVDAVASFIIGLQTAWLAPFSRLGHGVFLAIVFGLSFLQLYITEQGVPRGMILFMTIATPIMVIVGARLGESWWGSASKEADRPKEQA